MEKIKNKKILIDSNILVYCWDKNFGSGAQKLLRKLKDNGNSLATSEINCLELLKNAIDPERRSYYLKLISYLGNLDIEQPALLNACILYHNYYKEWPNKCTMETPDLVIGGTIMYNRGSLLLTANRRHFSRTILEK